MGDDIGRIGELREARRRHETGDIEMTQPGPVEAIDDALFVLRRKDRAYELQPIAKDDVAYLHVWVGHEIRPL